MHRREFLKSSSVAALAATGAAAIGPPATATPRTPQPEAPAILTRRRELRLVTRYEDRPSGNGDLARRLAARIMAASEGAWRIDVETGGDGGIDVVRNGAADLYLTIESDNGRAHPAFHYLAGLPCGVGLDGDAFEAWLTAAGGQDLWDELAGSFDIKALAVGSTGPSHGVVCNRPIRERADLKGLQICVDGLAREVLLACDAVASTPQQHELADALEQRLIDGAELLQADFHFHDIQSGTRLWRAAHIMVPGLNRHGLTVALGMRRGFWDQLANSERIMLTALAAEARAMGRSELLAHQRTSEQMAVAPRPWMARPSSPAELARDLESIAATIVAEMSGRDAMTRRINASYMAFRSQSASQSTA